jgi:soluble lytic murein transglycosylase-like protein
VAFFVCVLALTLPATAGAKSDPALARRVTQHVFKAHWRTAYCIARYESTWNPRAISPGGGNYGLFQINVVHRGWADWSRILDPYYNARIAYRLSHGGRNWSAWSTHGMCGV